MSTLLAAIRAREAAVSGARVTVVGTLVDDPVRYTAVELRVSADCPDTALLERLVEIADRGCIMTNTLRATLALSVRVLAPEAPPTT